MFIDIVGTDLSTMKQYPKTINTIHIGSFRIATHEIQNKRDPVYCLDLTMQGGWVEHIVCESESEAQNLYTEFMGY